MRLLTTLSLSLLLNTTMTSLTLAAAAALSSQRHSLQPRELISGGGSKARAWREQLRREREELDEKETDPKQKEADACGARCVADKRMWPTDSLVECLRSCVKQIGLVPELADDALEEVRDEVDHGYWDCRVKSGLSIKDCEERHRAGKIMPDVKGLEPDIERQLRWRRKRKATQRFSQCMERGALSREECKKLARELEGEEPQEGFHFEGHAKARMSAFGAGAGAGVAWGSHPVNAAWRPSLSLKEAALGGLGALAAGVGLGKAVIGSGFRGLGIIGP